MFSFPFLHHRRPGRRAPQCTHPCILTRCGPSFPISPSQGTADGAAGGRSSVPCPPRGADEAVPGLQGPIQGDSEGHQLPPATGPVSSIREPQTETLTRGIHSLSRRWSESPSDRSSCRAHLGPRRTGGNPSTLLSLPPGCAWQPATWKGIANPWG